MPVRSVAAVARNPAPAATLLALGGLCLLALTRGTAPLGFEAALTPAAGNAPGEPSAMLLRLALLLPALSAPRHWHTSAVVTAFLASLALRGGLLPYAAVALVVALLPERLPQTTPGARFAAVASVALTAAACGVLAVGTDLPSPPAVVPADAEARVAFFAERGNLFRARAAALNWCQREPSRGCQVLAQLGRELGMSDQQIAAEVRSLAGAPTARPPSSAASPAPDEGR